MMVSVIVRDVEGGAVCAGAGVEGPAPLLLSAGSGTRKTRWPSIAAVFLFFSLSLSLSLSLSFRFFLLLSQRNAAFRAAAAATERALRCSLLRGREGDEEVAAGTAKKKRS
jgi:hypothetical protein